MIHGGSKPSMAWRWLRSACHEESSCLTRTNPRQYDAWAAKATLRKRVRSFEIRCPKHPLFRRSAGKDMYGPSLHVCGGAPERRHSAFKGRRRSTACLGHTLGTNGSKHSIHHARSITRCPLLDTADRTFRTFAEGCRRHGLSSPRRLLIRRWKRRWRALPRSRPVPRVQEQERARKAKIPIDE